MSINVVLAVGAALMSSLIAPLFLRRLLKSLGVIDTPNIRSSHSRPVIRGMGLSPLVALSVGYLVLSIGTTEIMGLPIWIVIGISFASAALGWAEDFRGLPIRNRAVSQLLIGFMGSICIVYSTVGPIWLIPLLGIGIAAYINVANFMDGVNGISGFHGVVTGITFAILGYWEALPWLSLAGLLLAVAFLGFLPWNFSRAGMFLGDVGSYLLGGSIGALAALGIAHGISPLAVLGPLVVYLADSGSTLFVRMYRRERWFEPHRGHTYQRMLDDGMSHLQVSLVVTMASAATAFLGILVTWKPEYYLAFIGLAALVVAVYFLAPRWLSRSSMQSASHRGA